MRVDPLGPGAARDAGQGEAERAAAEERRAPVKAGATSRDDRGVAGVGAHQLDAPGGQKTERARVELDGGRVGIAGPRRAGDERAAGGTQLGIALLAPRRRRAQEQDPQRRQRRPDGEGRAEPGTWRP